MKTLHLAIIVGIGIGIAVTSTILITFVMNPAPHAEMTIEGLQDKYTVGEKLDFSVIAKGYGSYCNGPSVEIYNATNRSQLIWGGSYMQYTGMYCNLHEFNYVFHVGEPDSYSISGKVPIILDKPGEYLVDAHIETHLIVSNSEQEFSVIPNVSNIIIPEGAEDPSSGKNYEPRYLVVVLGINNTVKWTNESPSAAHTIVADNHDDPLFWNATHSANSVLLLPGKSFNFTFTKAGEFQYDTEPHPWMYGWVLVLSQSAKNVTTTVSLNASSGITGASIQQTNTIFGDFYQGIENDSGIVSIKNQTYYMMTASNTTYPIAHGMTVKFHNVTFSFPYGSQATPGGILIPFDMTFPDGTTEAYGNVTKNPNGSGSISGIGLGPGPSSNRTVTVQSDHMHPQAGVTLTEDQVKLLVSTDMDTTISQTPENHTLPASFMPCQDPYPQKYQGIPTLYMPLNSTGKICVRYHNLNDFPVRIGIGISEANNLTQDAKDVSTWNDSGNNTISAGDSTIVYWVKTGNQQGLYGLTVFCVPMPFAVGYDNSTLGKNNFPWLGQNTWFCPAELYDFHIDSTTGFKVGYIAEK